MLTWFATIAASWHRLIVACEVPSKGEAIFHEVTEVFAISILPPPFLSLLPPPLPFPPAFFPSVEQLHLFPRSRYARLLIMRAVSDLEKKMWAGSATNSRSFDGMANEMVCRWHVAVCVCLCTYIWTAEMIHTLEVSLLKTSLGWRKINFQYRARGSKSFPYRQHVIFLLEHIHLYLTHYLARVAGGLLSLFLSI